MPTQKDLKRVVRRRMQKTGESYTAARANLLKKHKAPPPEDYARLAGMSDDAVKAKTGCSWERWVNALDYAGAGGMTHREIAEYVHSKFSVSGWWAQTVTVGYERIKGLRAIGQRRGGTYDVSKSRTVGVPIARLYRAFSEKRQRTRWLPVDLTIRTSAREKSMRITWDDGTAVDVYFTTKGAAKSQVSVQHRKLASKAAADRQRGFWQERLTTLAELLDSGPPVR